MRYAAQPAPAHIGLRLSVAVGRRRVAFTITGKKFASPEVSLFLKEPYLPVIEVIFGAYYLYLSRIDKRPDYR